MSRAVGRLERHYRLLLRAYPAAWRRHHEDELVGVLLDQAEAEQRSRVDVADVTDLVGHGAEVRLEELLRWLPIQLRQRVAMVALTVGAGLSLVLLAGEMYGARHLTPADETGYGGAFLSGPFLTIGVGLYLAQMTAALLVVLDFGVAGRLLLLAAVAYAGWLSSPLGLSGYPRPRLLVLVLLAGLGLAGALATVRPSRRTSHRLVGCGVGFVLAVLGGLLLTKPLLGWSVGTMATSGNVAVAALATVLPFVGGVSMLTAAAVSGRHPGWPAATAIAALPVVVFCAGVSQVVNPAQADGRALIPVYYLLVVASVAFTDRRARRRSVAD